MYRNCHFTDDNRARNDVNDLNCYQGSRAT